MSATLRLAVRCGVLALVAAVAATASSCSAPPPPLALHNLERPTDMVFGCVGMLPAPSTTAGGTDLTPVVSGRPMVECHVPGRFDAPSDPARRTFGFVTNTARGEISVIDMDASKLVDLDPTNPDTNVAPLGVLPVQIAASDDGCRIVSANRGSCDLTMVDIGALVRPTLIKEDKVDASAPLQPFTQQVIVRTADDRLLHVAPQEVLFLPQDTSSLVGTQATCGDMPVAPPVGWSGAYQSTATGWKALVTFPTCNLVALVDLPSGVILDSIQMGASSDGTTVQMQNTGASPVCPETDFCDGRLPTETPNPDASTPVDPAAFSNDPFVNPTGVRPGTMAMRPGGERVYVGLGQAAFVIALDLRSGHLVIPDAARIPLHEGARGVDRVRLSVDPYKATGIPGQYGGFVGEGPLRDRQFLYAIARDGTVRIVDVSRSARLLPEIECDANIDPATNPDPSVACRPAFPPSPNRRPFTNGPGIRLPAVPIDVAAVDLTSNDPRNNWEGVLDGVYAFVLTSNGGIYVVNIAPTLRTKTLAGLTTGVAVDAPLPESPPLVNSLRDHNVLTYVLGQDPTLGPPRLDLPPTLPPTGPQILAINTTSASDNVLATACPTPTTAEGCPTFAFFPHRTSVQRQTWAVTWEGDFVGPNFSGQVSIDTTQQTMQLKELGSSFCSAGVLPGDFVTLFGCTADTQCGPEQVCKRSDTAPDNVGTVPINGLCMPSDATEQARRINACQPLLNSVRRYEILDAKDDGLTVRPRIDEIASATLDTCTRTPPMEGKFTCTEITDPSRNAFTCESVDGNPTLRCVQVCDPAALVNTCRTGRACVKFGSKSLCADAPPLDGSVDYSEAGCPLDQLLAYKVGAGNAFLVQGTAPAVYIPGRVGTGGTCEADPNRLDRIPIFKTSAGTRSVPLCDPGVVADIDLDLAPTTDLNAHFLALMNTTPPGGGASTIASPCIHRLFKTITDVTGTARRATAYYALFQNRELRFVLANLENYLGDYEQILFDVHGGFQPETVLIPVTVATDAPARLLSSPIDSQGQSSDLANTQELPFLFVIDQRRLQRPSAGLGATRGQVLRVYSRKVTTTDVNSLLPVYDDFTSSGNLWPIQ